MTTLCWGQHYRGRVAGLLPVLRGQPPVLGRLPGQRLRPPLVPAVDLVLGVLGPRAAAQLLRRDERDVAVPDADLGGRSEVRGGEVRGRGYLLAGSEGLLGAESLPHDSSVPAVCPNNGETPDHLFTKQLIIAAIAAHRQFLYIITWVRCWCYVMVIINYCKWTT